MLQFPKIGSDVEEKLRLPIIACACVWFSNTVYMSITNYEDDVETTDIRIRHVEISGMEGIPYRVLPLQVWTPA
jgi:hypothetical protein